MPSLGNILAEIFKKAKTFYLRSEYAKILYDNGLRLANPKDKAISSAFNDSLSTVAIYRGNDFSEWHGQTHPLFVCFP